MGTQTIEQTGKSWKLVMVASVVCLVIGVGKYLCAKVDPAVATSADPMPPWAWWMIGGGVGLVLGQAGAWWNHG